MSAPTDGRGKETVAAGFMAVFLTAALGGLGLVLAAIAVGTERAWNGRSGGTADTARQGWRRTRDDHRAWLAADRRRSDEWRAARRKWWQEGADPATRPAQPKPAVRVGSGVRRWWSRLVVGAGTAAGAAARFGAGCRDGWRAGQRVRRDGGTFRDVASARPGPATEPEDRAGDPPVDAPENPAEPNAADAQKDPKSEKRDDMDVQVMRDEDTNRMRAADVALGRKPHKRTPVEALVSGAKSPGGAGRSGSAGETNLDLTVLDLGSINARLAKIRELNDAQAAERAALQAAVMHAAERVGANGGTAATTQALDEANAVVDLLGQHLGAVADATESACEQTSAAEAGLRPAQDAQDALHTSGARGEFVSTATAD